MCRNELCLMFVNSSTRLLSCASHHLYLGSTMYRRMVIAVCLLFVTRVSNLALKEVAIRVPNIII